jgi:putative methyltransferase (TIGR04325 family)
MGLKTWLRWLAPPLAVELYRRARGSFQPGYWWQGIYPHYRDVPVVGAGYESDSWIRPRALQTQNLLAQLQHHGSLPETVPSRYLLLPALAAALVNPARPLRILDFGGAMGIAYVYLLDGLAEAASLQYYLVDNARSCTEGRRLFAGDERIRFLDHLPSDVPPIQVIYMSGVLQYVEDYQGVLQRLVDYRPDFFLITYLAAGNIPTYAAAQVNLKESVLPAWFFNLDELCRLIAPAGYQVAYRGASGPALDMRNFPASHRLERMADLLFVRC